MQTWRPIAQCQDSGIQLEAEHRVEMASVLVQQLFSTWLNCLFHAKLQAKSLV